jgi:hypothetical protein
MKLTRFFSRIRANGEFLHDEGTNLPFQGETTPEGQPQQVGYGQPGKDTPTEAGYLYHATNTYNLNDIAAGGLRTFRPSYGTDQEAWPDGSTERRSYWTDRANVAWHFAPEDGMPVLLRTRQTSDFKRESTGDWYARRTIPAVRLEVMLADGQWEPLK